MLLTKAIRRVLPKKWLRRAETPVNFRKRDCNPEVIAQDARHAIEVGRNIHAWLNDLGPLRGKRLLEVGPGHNFGSTLFLAGYGIIPAVADAFLAPWDPAYSPLFYRCLRCEMCRQFPELDTGPVSAVIAANGYPDDVLIRDVNPVETLSLASGSIDIAISNAVLEHLEDHRRAVQQLYRVTRPGGWNLHQVDFRYHGAFDRPLEHLLLTPAMFQARSRDCFRECGMQLRPFQLAALFREGGFAEVHFEANMLAEPAYFQDFLGRLRRTPTSDFCQCSDEELRPVAGLFRFRKGG